MSTTAFMATSAPESAPLPRILLRPAEVATCLGISRSKVYDLVNSGRLCCVRIDGSMRIRFSDLEMFTAALTDAPDDSSPITGLHRRDLTQTEPDRAPTVTTQRLSALAVPTGSRSGRGA